MNRKLLRFWEGIIVIGVKGKKIERFLSYLYKQKIHLWDVKCISREEAIIKIYRNDYEKVMNLKTTYQMDLIGYEGKLKLGAQFKKHWLMLLTLLLGYIFLVILSNVIFDVEVIHSNASIRNLIIDELADHNIKRWHFKQDFKSIEKIKTSILNKYKDRLEWIEIDNIGTKYIVKVEERKIPKVESNYIYQDIVSNKNAVIMKIEASEGEIVKRKNDYVKKGDVLISGKIMKGEEVSKLVKASGKIYGEVWYNIKVEHPLVYQRKIETGKVKKIYGITFLNYHFSLFNFHPFSSKTVVEDSIVSNPLVPFKIVRETQKEVKIEDEVYTDGEALVKAEALGIEKVKDSLEEDERIISSRKLKYYVDDKKMYLDMFFKVYESIGEARAITE